VFVASCSSCCALTISSCACGVPLKNDFRQRRTIEGLHFIQRDRRTIDPHRGLGHWIAVAAGAGGAGRGTARSRFRAVRPGGAHRSAPAGPKIILGVDSPCLGAVLFLVLARWPGHVRQRRLFLSVRRRPRRQNPCECRQQTYFSQNYGFRLAAIARLGTNLSAAMLAADQRAHRWDESTAFCNAPTSQSFG
jgi:hypothetical protein